MTIEEQVASLVESVAAIQATLATPPVIPAPVVDLSAVTNAIAALATQVADIDTKVTTVLADITVATPTP